MHNKKNSPLKKSKLDPSWLRWRCLVDIPIYNTVWVACSVTVHGFQSSICITNPINRPISIHIVPPQPQISLSQYKVMWVVSDPRAPISKLETHIPTVCVMYFIWTVWARKLYRLHHLCVFNVTAEKYVFVVVVVIVVGLVVVCRLRAHNPSNQR